MRRIGMLLLMASALASHQAMAYTINVDFQAKIDVTPNNGSNVFSIDYSGTAAAPDTGTVWNALTPGNTGTDGYNFQDTNVGLYDRVTAGTPSYTNLLDSQGNATSVGLSVDAGGVFSTANNAGNLTNIATNAKDLMRDYLIAFDHYELPGARTVTVSGLPAGQQVKLWLYGEGDQASNSRQTRFDANGVIGATSGDAVNMPLTEGPHYVALSGVFANGNGEISIVYTANNVDEGPFNGFQLTTVPEPATIALLGLAGLGLLAIRRK
jgi:PEP-CTERM motif